MKGLSLLWFLRSLDNGQGKPRASLIYRRGSPCAVFANGVIGCPSAVDSDENRCIQSSCDDREMDERLKKGVGVDLVSLLKFNLRCVVNDAACVGDFSAYVSF